MSDKNINSKQGKCCICLENTEITLPCGHFSHADCIESWKTQYNSCPVCRAPIDKDKKVTKFKYIPDTSNDANIARRTMDQEMKNMIEQKLNDLNNVVQMVMEVENAIMQRISQNPQFLIYCACCNCQLNPNAEFINCRYCGDFFYCSRICERQHMHNCSKKPISKSEQKDLEDKKLENEEKEKKEKNIFFINCVMCGDKINIEDSRSCEKCNNWFYCSTRCQQSHHCCAKRRRIEPSAPSEEEIQSGN